MVSSSRPESGGAGRMQSSESAESRADLDLAFQALAERWRRDNRLISSARKMVLHPAYRQIIGKGPAVIPLILRELQARPDHWFWALHAITGEDPAPHDADFDGAVRAWLAWGRERGFVPE